MAFDQLIKPGSPDPASCDHEWQALQDRAIYRCAHCGAETKSTAFGAIANLKHPSAIANLKHPLWSLDSGSSIEFTIGEAEKLQGTWKFKHGHWGPLLATESYPVTYHNGFTKVIKLPSGPKYFHVPASHNLAAFEHQSMPSAKSVVLTKKLSLKTLEVSVNSPTQAVKFLKELLYNEYTFLTKAGHEIECLVMQDPVLREGANKSTIIATLNYRFVTKHDLEESNVADTYVSVPRELP